MYNCGNPPPTHGSWHSSGVATKFLFRQDRSPARKSSTTFGVTAYVNPAAY
jgi:hypothetical protein